jgi:hypothetical protein
MKKYAIIPTDRIDEIDFSQLKQTPETVRKSNDKLYFIIEFQGEKPDFINEHVYTYAEILEEMKQSNWVRDEEDI